MNKNLLLATLVTSLGITTGTTAPSAQELVLGAWVEAHLPDILVKVETLVTPPLSWSEPGALIDAVVSAANDPALRTLLAGTRRAQLVDVVVRFVLREYVPLERLGPVGVLLEEAVLPRLIRYAYLRLVSVAAVVDAPELPAGGVR